MKKLILVGLVLSVSAIASAGSDSADCPNRKSMTLMSQNTRGTAAAPTKNTPAVQQAVRETGARAG